MQELQWREGWGEAEINVRVAVEREGGWGELEINARVAVERGRGGGGEGGGARDQCNTDTMSLALTVDTVCSCKHWIQLERTLY